MKLTLLSSIAFIVSGDIIGNDNRFRSPNISFPYSAIGIVETGLGTCTGTMIGAQIMLTAFHCLHFDNGILQGLAFTPGVNQEQNPYRPVHGKEVYWLNEKFKHHFQTGLVEDHVTAYDFTVVKLSERIGELTGWMDVGEFLGEYDNPWLVTGYEQNVRTQLHQTAIITGYISYDWLDVKAYTIRTNADFMIGQSGSPLYKEKNGTYTIMGVMSTMQGTHSEAGGGTALYKLVKAANR